MNYINKLLQGKDGGIPYNGSKGGSSKDGVIPPSSRNDDRPNVGVIPPSSRNDDRPNVGIRIFEDGFAVLKYPPPSKATRHSEQSEEPLTKTCHSEQSEETFDKEPSFRTK